MPTLQQIIQSYSWSDVEPDFLGLYPEWKQSVGAHARVFEVLRFLPARDDPMQIVIEPHPDSGGVVRHHVCGRDGTSLRESMPGVFDPEDPRRDEEESFALDFTEWERWLGMRVRPETLAAYRELEVVAHCLWEMTVRGYSPEEVAAKRRMLDQATQEAEKYFRRLTDPDPTRDSGGVE